VPAGCECGRKATMEHLARSAAVPTNLNGIELKALKYRSNSNGFLSASRRLMSIDEKARRIHQNSCGLKYRVERLWIELRAVLE